VPRDHGIGQDPDLVAPPRLSTPCERRGEEAASYRPDERPSVHKNPRMTADLGGMGRGGQRVELTTAESCVGVPRGSAWGRRTNWVDNLRAEGACHLPTPLVQAVNSATDHFPFGPRHGVGETRVGGVIGASLPVQDTALGLALQPRRVRREHPPGACVGGALVRRCAPHNTHVRSA